MNRVAFYTRVSSEEQAKEGVSLPEQKERLDLWVKLENCQNVDLYSDPGLSGTHDRRPELQRLMVDARAGMFDLVVATKLDRFMRNNRLLLNYIHELEELGIGFVALSDGIDTRKPGSSKILLSVIGAVAEFERDRIAERVRDFRSKLASEGRWSSGRTTFGYRFNKDMKLIVIFEPEAEIVRYIFYVYVNERIGIVRLAERLNGEQRLTPRWGRRKHNIWTPSAVRHVLTHPAYKGGPNEDWKFKTPPIVDTTTWLLAQKRLQTNRHFKPAKSKSEFQGIFRCGLCGHTLRVGWDHNTKRRYECPGRLKRLHLEGSQRCLLPRFDQKQLEESTSRQIFDIFRDPKVLAEHVRRTIKEIKQEFEQLENRVSPLYGQVQRIEEDMAIVDAKLEMRKIDPVEYKMVIAGLQTKLREARNQCRELDPLELESLLKDNMVREKLFQYSLDKFALYLYEALPDKLDEMASMPEMVDIEYLQSFAGSPIDLIRKYGITPFVYPDHIDLKGLLPLDIKRQSNISPGCRSARCRQFQ